MALRDLPQADMTAEETVVLPPAAPLKENATIRARLAALDAQTSVA